MIATKKVISVLFFAVLFLPAFAAAQITAPTPISDTAKRVDTTKKTVFTLRTVGMAPVYLFEMNDNAKIDAAHQFPGARPLPDSCYYHGERHLKNIRQLTFEGVNTRPAISPDDRYLAFQSHGIKPNSCDQIYRMPLTGVPAGRISSGQGRATGAEFLSDDEILFSSTQAVNGGSCPKEKKTFEKGSDLYIADTDGKNIRRLTSDSAHFSGGASVSANGKLIIFTNTRTGSAELFSMRRDGDGSTQRTYDDASHVDASYSPNGNDIVFCESNPNNPAEAGIYVMTAEGRDVRQVTHLGGTNCNPCWVPDGEHVVFSSNYLDPSGKAFDLFMIKRDGTGLERLTYGGGFNGFPVFTRDGNQLVFCSSRNATHPGDVNMFAADWAQ
ncbi:MAG TPA: hypothetical protein VFH95_07430 [Candidatus Kapabacteria bacterium]|nr:hypothetical protein [Candidatus Kapabacteria bacterium]